MEARLLADVLKTDTHVRVQASEELSEWMRSEENDPEAFPELDRLVGGLAQWMGSSNHKVEALRSEGEGASEEGCHYLEYESGFYTQKSFECVHVRERLHGQYVHRVVSV